MNLGNVGSYASTRRSKSSLQYSNCYHFFICTLSNCKAMINKKKSSSLLYLSNLAKILGSSIEIPIGNKDSVQI